MNNELIYLAVNRAVRNGAQKLRLSTKYYIGLAEYLNVIGEHYTRAELLGSSHIKIGADKFQDAKNSLYVYQGHYCSMEFVDALLHLFKEIRAEVLNDIHESIHQEVPA